MSTLALCLVWIGFILLLPRFFTILFAPQVVYRYFGIKEFARSIADTTLGMLALWLIYLDSDVASKQALLGVLIVIRIEYLVSALFRIDSFPMPKLPTAIFMMAEAVTTVVLATILHFG